MAKSKNGATEQASGEITETEAAKAELSQGSVKNPKESPVREIPNRKQVPGNSKESPAREIPNRRQVPNSKQLGRPKKQSRRGKGGGPKTAAGKAKVSRNAIKHGIMSKSPVIPGMEEEAEWQAHRAAAVESLEPDGHLETVLAERIAFLFWRFLRVARYETAVTAKGVDFEGVDAPDAEMWLLPTNSHLDRIMRYDGNIQRQLVQTYNLFEAVQARRKGQPVNHTRIDIGSSPQFRNTRAPALSDAFANLN